MITIMRLLGGIHLFPGLYFWYETAIAYEDIIRVRFDITRTGGKAAVSTLKWWIMGRDRR